MKWYQENLKKFNFVGSKHVFDIVTCGETWFYSYETETKEQSTVWMFPTVCKECLKKMLLFSANLVTLQQFFGESENS